jgi:hypothetical protein
MVHPSGLMVLGIRTGFTRDVMEMKDEKKLGKNIQSSNFPLFPFGVVVGLVSLGLIEPPCQNKTTVMIGEKNMR